MKDKLLPFILSLLVLSVIVPFAYAAPSGSSSTLIVKNGNAFTSASGSYATSSHCVNPTCSWISGNQAIIGVYYSSPTTWQGGMLEYDFDLSRYAGIQKVDLIVEWPNSIGKGLHSPVSTGGGKIAIGSPIGILATYPVTNVRCIPANDYFAHPCSQFSITKNIPLNLVHATTKVYLIANNVTAWDVGKVSLRVTTNRNSRCPPGLSCRPNGTPI